MNSKLITTRLIISNMYYIKRDESTSILNLSDTQNLFHKVCISTYMVYLHTTSHIPSSKRFIDYHHQIADKYRSRSPTWYCFMFYKHEKKEITYISNDILYGKCRDDIKY
jgi:hypothetical protein